MKKIILSISFIVVGLIGFSQNPEPPTNLYGQSLRTWLRNNWYNGYHNTLGYSSARQEMYSYVDNEGGQVYCVYTGFHQAAAFTSYLNPINAEHTVPQSFFSSAEPMKSDIHHLFPTHQDVNSARSNLPFAEINDSFTDKWYIGNSSGIIQSTNIPSSNIDNYSELRTNTSFEPREDHKGNAARALFYFFTMYPTQAGSIDDVADIETLYQWHLDDPVDAQEVIRNNKVQEVQGNYNPYISLPDLVAAAWGFDDVEVEEIQQPEITIYPNPTTDQLVLTTNKPYHYIVQSSMGKIVLEGEVNHSTIKVSSLAQGLYHLVLIHGNHREAINFVKKKT